MFLFLVCSSTNRKRILEEKEFEKPKVDEPPSFSFELRQRTIQANSEFKLICCVQAHPAPKITWLKDGAELSANDNISIMYSHGICTMEISQAKPADSGKYTCVAKNPLGEQECACKVVVEDRVHSGGSGSALGLPPRPSRSIRRTKSGHVISSDSSSYEASSTNISSSSSSSSSVKKSSRVEFSESSSSSSSSTTVRSSKKTTSTTSTSSILKKSS
jgi:hypothetical protein